MSCPSCTRAAELPLSGSADAACLDCCCRVIEGLRPHRDLQERAFAAWERMPGYVGTDAVKHQLAVRAQMRAMAPIKGTK